MSPTVHQSDAQTMASLASALQACQQALQAMQLQQQQQPSVNTVATGVNDSPSSNQAPVGSIGSPAVNVSDVPITTVPIATNVATNNPITNLPFVDSPITTTPIADNAVNTVAPYSNDAITGTTAIGNVANVVSITDCPTTVVSFADSPLTTNVAEAQVGAFLTALTTLIQQNAVKLSASGTPSAPSPAPVPAPPSTPAAGVQVDSKTAQVLQQLHALGFNNTRRNLGLLKHFNGDYFQTLNQLLAERK